MSGAYSAARIFSMASPGLMDENALSTGRGLSALFAGSGYQGFFMPAAVSTARSIAARISASPDPGLSSMVHSPRVRAAPSPESA